MQSVTTLKFHIEEYLKQIAGQVSRNSERAYRYDLMHFLENMDDKSFKDIDAVNSYISSMYSDYEEISIKRKIASIKLFYQYLFQKEEIPLDFIERLNTCGYHFRPEYKAASITELESFYQECYEQYKMAESDYRLFQAIRNIVLTQLLFSTGIAISELCELHPGQVDVAAKVIVLENGRNKRVLSINNTVDIKILEEYLKNYEKEINACDYLFLNRDGEQLSEQSIRRIIAKIARDAGIRRKLTPSMFRNAFIELSIRMGTDIKKLKEILGHNSYGVIKNHQDKLNYAAEDKIIYQNPLSLLEIRNT